MKNNISNLIRVLKELEQTYGEIPISINLINDRVLAVKNVYFDNSDGNPQLLFEADLEDRSECGRDINVFSSDGILETLIKVGDDDHKAETFSYDLDKMYDLLELTREEFLESYLYISNEEYYYTAEGYFPDNENEAELGEYNMTVISNLADLYRQAENLYIEDLNGRDTGFLVTGGELKERIIDFVNKHLTPNQIKEFQDECDAMAC